MKYRKPFDFIKVITILPILTLVFFPSSLASAQGSQQATFITARETAGAYAVDVSGVTGSLVVRETAESGTAITLFSVTPSYAWRPVYFSLPG